MTETPEQPEDAGMDAAPEGASDEARPDEQEETSGEGGVTDPDAEQQDPESGPAAS